MLDMGNIFKLPSLINTVMSNVETDFTKSEMLSMINVFKGAISENFSTEMIPGSPQYIKGISYWVVDDDKVKTLVGQVISGVETQTAPETDSPAQNSNSTAGQ